VLLLRELKPSPLTVEGGINSAPFNVRSRAEKRTQLNFEACALKSRHNRFSPVFSLAPLLVSDAPYQIVRPFYPVRAFQERTSYKARAPRSAGALTVAGSPAAVGAPEKTCQPSIFPKR